MFSVLIAPPSLYVAASLAPLVMLVAVIARTWRHALSPSEKVHTTLILLLCLAALCPNASHALNLLNSPDSPEYAIGAVRMLTLGSYDIPLHGSSYPPRYPIGFSLFILLPSLLLSSGSTPAAAVVSVAFCTALGAPSAFIIAKRTYSETAGYLAVILYLLLPGLWPSSQEILSFAPAAAFWLLTIALVVVSVEPRRLDWWGSLAIGTSSMYAMACRPLSALIIAPIVAFILIRDRSSQRLFLLLLPVAILATLYVTYNTLVFHAPFRSGYHFWCGIPFDIPSLSFNATYFWSNLRPFWDSGVPLLGMLALSGYRAYSNDPRKLLTLGLVASAATMLSGAHLFYFYPWTLFFLPAAAVLVPLAMCSLAWFLDKSNIRLSRMVTSCALVATALLSRTLMHTSSYRESPHTRFLSSISHILPDDAVFISGMNPVYVSLVLQRPRIAILPISREVEYASKVITPLKLPTLPRSPLSAYDHRSSLLPPDSFQEAFPEVPTERLETIASLLSEGREVFIDTRYSAPDDITKLSAHFSLVQSTPGVSRASLRPLKE